MNPATPAPIAVITGASRGLGRSMALHLARQGTDILLTYQREAAKAQDVVGEIAAMGRNAFALQLDIGSKQHLCRICRAGARRTAQPVAM